jgi:hypothetical protein
MKTLEKLSKSEISTIDKNQLMGLLGGGTSASGSWSECNNSTGVSSTTYWNQTDYSDGSSCTTFRTVYQK